jgi:replicative DNA helicase
MISEVRGNRLHTFSASLIDLADLQSKHGVKLGWTDLDLALGGLLPGQVVTVLAKTGVGKTAFLSQVVFNQSMWQSYDKKLEGPGVPTLVLSLEQTRSEMATRLERIARLYNPWESTENASKWYSLMRINDENAVPPEDVDILVEEYIEQTGMPPRMLIVDYLGYWARSFKGNSKYEQVTEAIMEMKRIAKKFEVTIVVPHQVSRVGDRGKRLELDMARDSGAVEETSDFVFGLYRPHENRDNDDAVEIAPWQRRADIRLEVLKSRHGNVGKETRMFWAPYSLSMTAINSSEEPRVQKEWAAFDKQLSYEQVIPILKGKAFV